MINKVIASRYKILERVGIGGMAEVYKAQDEVLGRTDAVKVLLPQFASDPTFAARFRQEAQAAANLSSPYIVSIYDWGLDGETYYIVMEFVKGVDLKTAIAQRGTIEQRKVAHIASQICAGLSVAHDNDVIHRDIKPQNIMIQPDGNIKIMDFGVAKAGNSTMTQTGSVLGTANYVSPEQAQGKTPTAESDIYSLGILMYEAVTGRLPFEGPDAISVALKQVNETPVPPSVYCPTMDSDLEEIILKAMEKDPKDRFSTASEMRTTLMDYINGIPINLGNADETQVLAEADATRVLGEGANKTQVFAAQNGADAKSSKGKKSNRKRNIIIGVCVVVAIAIIGCVIGFGLLGGTASGTVPNVLGMTQEEAEQALENSGYKVGTVTQDYSSEYEAGEVMKQNPEAGTELAENSSVDLVISQGEPPANQVSVPNLKNMSIEEATEELSALNLQVVTGNAVQSTEVSIGYVAAQDPSAGTLVDEGTTITIYPSSGTTVPSVMGMTESAAVSALRSAGLSVTVQTQESDETSGTVIAMSINSGEVVNPGSSITITVATAPTTTTPDDDSSDSSTVSVPNVVGLDESTAISRITSAGLKYYVVYQTSSSVDEGYVISTNPSSGTEVSLDDTVAITVSGSSSSSDDEGTDSTE